MRRLFSLICLLFVGGLPLSTVAAEMPIGLVVSQGCCACRDCDAGEACWEQRTLEQCDHACKVAGCQTVAFSFSSTCQDGCGLDPEGAAAESGQ